MALLTTMQEWRQEFLDVIASKRYTVAPAFVNYVANTALTTEEEAVVYYFRVNNFMRHYEQDFKSSSGYDGLERQDPAQSLKDLYEDLKDAAEPISWNPTYTIAEGLPGEPTEGKYGMYKDPLDGSTDFGNLDPSQYAGGASVEGGWDFIELTADPQDASVYAFVRPIEDLPYSKINFTYQGTTWTLLRQNNDGWAINDAELAALIISNNGGSLVVTLELTN